MTPPGFFLIHDVFMGLPMSWLIKASSIEVIQLYETGCGVLCGGVWLSLSKERYSEIVKILEGHNAR